MFNSDLSNKQRELSLHGQEVVKEINEQPHLLVRLEIRGGYFPHLAPEPFVQIVVSDRQTISSWFANVSEDNCKLRGYFTVDLPEQGMIEFGYGNKVMGKLPVEFESKDIIRLDRKRLSKDVIIVSTDYQKENT